MTPTLPADPREAARAVVAYIRTHGEPAANGVPAMDWRDIVFAFHPEANENGWPKPFVVREANPPFQMETIHGEWPAEDALNMALDMGLLYEPTLGLMAVIR